MNVDMHCHLDLYPDPFKVAEECKARGTYILSVTTTPKAWTGTCKLAQGNPCIQTALGLHPQLVGERANEISLFEQFLPETRYVGEVGLDAGPRHYRSFELQNQIFRKILGLCAKAGNKVLSVHSVRAAKQVLDLIEECLPADRGVVVLHWFTGTVAEVRRGVQLGCYFSVNERMLSSSSGRRVLGEIPADRLLTETDGPFVERSGQPVGPGDVLPTLREAANIKGVSIEDVQRHVVENLRSLLKNTTT